MTAKYPLLVNCQPPEKQAFETGFLDVVDVWETIQGEGPFVGEPAVFVRLAGCNLQCPGCDTEYTTNRRFWDQSRLVDAVKSLRKSPSLVVVTGGEPFRQNFGPFVRELLADDYLVQVETNGTLYQPDFPYIPTHIVCSPKTPKLNPDLIPQIDHLKYVVQAEHMDPEDGLPTMVLGSPCRPVRPWAGFDGVIYVQPMDEGDWVRNRANQMVALASCFKFGYRYCHQLHKVLELK
jgi:7-carboxy-7-deazaguanine synthase